MFDLGQSFFIVPMIQNFLAFFLISGDAMTQETVSELFQEEIYSLVTLLQLIKAHLL